VAGLAASFGSGAMTNSVPDLEEADCILIVGSNTTEQHPIIGTRILRAQEERGTKLIVADPRRIQMVMHADLWLRQRPGSDIAWLNGMMNVIISEGLADEEFVANRVEGFEEVKEVVAKYTPDVVERISGIPQEELRQAALMYGQAERAAIVYAMGITQHTTGVDHVKACANLAMITGNLGRAGTGVNPLRGQNNVQGACDMGALANVYPGYQAVTSPESKEKFEQAWGVTECSDQVGLTVTEMIDAAEKGEVKAMYVMGENPVLSDPDSNHVIAALRDLDLLIVQDIFLTETAELADVVLPGCSYAERDGTFTGTDRRVQLVRQAIPPIGDSRADWVIICELAQRMGASGFEYASPREIMEEIATLTPIYGGVSYERLEELGFLQWPCRAAEDPGTLFLHQGQFTRGLGKMHVVEHQDPAEMPDEKYPFILTTGRNMFQYHTGSMTRRTAKLEHESPVGYVEVNPQDAAELGVSDGQQVRVSSRRGQIEARAWVTGRVPRGLVFAPFHYAEASANVLTNPALDPMAKIPEYKVCAVRVEALSSGRGLGTG
jgi:formate dehydrogenase alpha subunit